MFIYSVINIIGIDAKTHIDNINIILELGDIFYIHILYRMITVIYYGTEYDVTDFTTAHPGGNEYIRLTTGLDITHLYHRL